MKMRILVVDDDPTIIQIYKIALSASYDLSVAYNGKEALEMAISDPPALIVMDIMMPVMDGLEALEKLKESAATAKVPVILLTAQVQPKDVIAGYNTGADYYITKPFTNKELLNGIKMFLSEKKA